MPRPGRGNVISGCSHRIVKPYHTMYPHGEQQRLSPPALHRFQETTGMHGARP